VVGTAAIDAGTVARIIKTRTPIAGFGRDEVGSHSRKRGTLTTVMDRGVHPQAVRSAQEVRGSRRITQTRLPVRRARAQEHNSGYIR
jgi:hypothetical protein